MEDNTNLKFTPSSPAMSKNFTEEEVTIQNRHGQSTIETSQGTLHVQPFRRSGSKKLKAVITFVPRTSHFDRENQSSSTDPFRGFFTLFWIALFLLTVRTYVTSFEQSGYPLSLAFATLFSRDAKTLLLSDIVLVSSTALVVPVCGSSFYAPGGNFLTLDKYTTVYEVGI